MQCTEFENRLNAKLDDRQRPEVDSLLAAHAAECDDCRQLLSLQAALLAGLSRRNVPPVSREFAQRVVAAVCRPAPAVVASTRPARAWLAIGAVMASAAVMLLAVSLVRMARRGDAVAIGGVEPAGKVVGNRPRQRSRLAMAQPGVARQKSDSQSSEAMTGADLLLAAPRLPGRLREYRGAFDELVVSWPTAAARLDEVEQVAPGIRPLRASFSIIWETLSLSIPAAGTKPGSGEAPIDGRSFLRPACCSASVA
jgi:hypothetical protein